MSGDMSYYWLCCYLCSALVGGEDDWRYCVELAVLVYVCSCVVV